MGNLLFSSILIRLAVSSILLLLISGSTRVRFHVQAGRAVPKSSSLSQAGNREEEAMIMKAEIGSRPPRCEKRCSWCGHCDAIQIPINPQLTGNHRSSASSTLSSVSNTEYAKGDDFYSNYKPMSWKCKCGNFIFNP